MFNHVKMEKNSYKDNYIRKREKMYYIIYILKMLLLLLIMYHTSVRNEKFYIW